MPGRADALELLPEGRAALRVEALGGLVEDEQGRLVHERAGEVEAPLHATRVRARQLAGDLGQGHELEQLVGAALDLGRGQPVHAAGQLERLAAGREGVERRRLEGQPEPLADLGG